MGKQDSVGWWNTEGDIMKPYYKSSLCGFRDWEDTKNIGLGYHVLALKGDVTKKKSGGFDASDHRVGSILWHKDEDSLSSGSRWR